MATKLSDAKAAAAAKKRPPFLVELYRSALGKKYVMAITGIIGLGYVLAHMLGNLKLYQSAGGVQPLRGVPAPLLYPIAPESGTSSTSCAWSWWRAGVTSSRRCSSPDEPAARPESYKAKRDYVAADFAARTMRWTGVIVLLFIAYHLADLTWGWVNPAPEGAVGLRQGGRELLRSRPSPGSTSWRTSRSGSTSTTGCGACSSRWGGTTVASTTGAARWPSVHGRGRRRQPVVPDRRARRDQLSDTTAPAPPALRPASRPTGA
jgi:hypothetical protein